MRIIWGYGGILIGTDDADYVDFPHAQTKISFEEVYNQFETIDRQIRKVFKGWRVRVTTIIHNIMATDYLLWQQLINQINIHAANGDPYWIAPRYDADLAIENRQAYLMHLMTTINPQDIGQGAAQSIELEFVGYNLLDQLPIYTDTQSIDNWVDENDEEYQDESGNTYQLYS